MWISKAKPGHDAQTSRDAIPKLRTRLSDRRTPTFLLALSLAAFGVGAGPLRASPIAPSPTDRQDDTRIVEQCLALTAANRNAFASSRSLSVAEPASAEARLRAAAQDARQAPESCIGIVARSCTGADSSASDNGQIACSNRELDVWDARLNEAYRHVISRADTDVRLRFIKVQRAWLSWRDASCAQPNVVFQGSMAGPMQARCLLDATARQAIWLENWE